MQIKAYKILLTTMIYYQFHFLPKLNYIHTNSKDSKRYDRRVDHPRRRIGTRQGADPSGTGGGSSLDRPAGGRQLKESHFFRE